ncbi:MAG: hypothetical protein KDH96_07150 [Candidatus Riesia sp.]|nr:hypothetical protein [Candidatus Riesia sp.]
MREEGVYLIKRVDSLPPRGNANYLYELKSDIPLTTRYRWKGGEYEALPIGSSSSSGYSFINSSDGLPNTDEDTTAYRTKPIGINEQNPVELIDVVGTQAEGQGGIKLDYTYDSGLITRVQLAGRSILNELGVPVDTIEGLFLDSFSPPSGSYPNFRSYFAGGDLSGVSPLLGDFCSIMGVSNLTSSKGVGINIYPIAGAGEFFTGNIRAFVSGGSQGSHSVAHRGGIAGEDQEHTASSIAANGTESSSINLTPHYIRFKNLMKMSDYGSGTFIESYTHTDTLAKTGTAETTIGAATFGLAVDADGNVMEVEPTKITWTPQTGFTAINVLASYNRNIFVDIGVFLSNGQVTIQPEDSGTRAYPDGMEFMVKAPSADAIDFNEGVGVTILKSGGGAITNLDKDTLWHCIYLGSNTWIIK